MMDPSLSVSQSKDQSEGEQLYSANAMEEYLRKKQGGGAMTATSKPAGTAKTKDISESSDKYTDEDFDSISKS